MTAQSTLPAGKVRRAALTSPCKIAVLASEWATRTGGTGCGAGPPIPPPRRPEEARTGLTGRRGASADGADDKLSGLVIGACGPEPTRTSMSAKPGAGLEMQGEVLPEAGCVRVPRWA